MAKTGRPPVLDHVKKREILAILAMGCSRRTAARYVGCSPKTILNTADRDPDFAAQLRRAEHASEIEYLQRIRNAAKKEQYWRAAAWALERINPEDFARRPPRSLTPDETAALLLQLADVLVAELPVGEYRKRVVKSLDRLLARIGAAPPPPADAAAENEPDDAS